MLAIAASSIQGIAITAAHGSAQETGSSLGYTTISDNDLRDGWDSTEPDLSPAAVGNADFGQLFRTQVDGQVYAAPLVVNRTDTSPGTLIVATENDQVYGLDPVDGTKQWQTSLGTPWSASVLNCGDLTPNIGVTSTPVYDPSTNTVYVMAKDAPNGATSKTPRWQLHALDADTGLERPGWPVLIGGHPDNDPTRTFNSETAAQRPALSLVDGVVYAGFASYCDHGPYVGYVVGVSTTTHTQTALFSTEAGTDDGEGGIWQSGGGMVSDGPGQLIAVTGNGDTAPVAASDAPPTALSEAVVRLQVQPDGTLDATDWFAPSNGATLNKYDADLGAGGPMAIPDGYGTTSYPDLLVEVGKDGRLFLLNRDDLGGNSQGPGGTDDVLGTTQLGNGVWGHPAFWGGTPGTDSAGGYVYVVENSGYLRALKLGSDANGTPLLVPTANSTNTFGYTSGSPVVTSDGTLADTALVWMVGVDGPTGTDPTLRAFNADPVNGVLNQVFSAPLTSPGVTNADSHGAKFTTVATDNGRVFVGTRDGYVFGFGQPSAAPIYTSPIDVGSVPVGTASTPAAVTLTASRPVTVTGVTTTSPYSLADAPTSPQVLDTNDTLTVHVELSPTTAGDQAGTLTVATLENGVAGSISFGLEGYGTQPGLMSSPSAVDFGVVPIPGHDTEGINLANTSGVDETVSSVSALDPPFSSSDLPTVGEVIPAGSSIAVPLEYAPTASSSGDSDTLSVGVDGDAEVLHVDLAGSADVGASNLVLQPTTLNFGVVPRGAAKSLTFQIANTGNILMTINKAKAPFGAFTTQTPVPEGQTITPDQSVIQSVTFSPTQKGTATATYEVTGNDGSGQHFVTLTGTDDQLTDRYNINAALRRLLEKPIGATTAIGKGYYRLFKRGEMFWLPPTGSHESHGRILTRYLSLKGPTGKLGFPTSDVRTTKTGLTQIFQHGRISWSKKHGFVVRRYS